MQRIGIGVLLLWAFTTLATPQDTLRTFAEQLGPFTNDALMLIEAAPTSESIKENERGFLFLLAEAIQRDAELIITQTVPVSYCENGLVGPPELPETTALVAQAPPAIWLQAFEKNVMALIQKIFANASEEDGNDPDDMLRQCERIESHIVQQRKMKTDETFVSPFDFANYSEVCNQPHVKGTCCICSEDFGDEHCAAKMERCAHTPQYCSDCLQGHLKAKLDEVTANLIRCPLPDCKAMATTNDTLRVKTRQQTAAVCRQYLEIQQAKTQAFYRCAAQHCQTFQLVKNGKSRIVTCDQCKVPQCMACGRLEPKGEKCEEHSLKAEEEAVSDKGMKALETLGVVQHCPSCQAPVVRIDNCPNVMCRCGRAFQYQGAFREQPNPSYNGPNWDAMQTQLETMVPEMRTFHERINSHQRTQAAQETAKRQKQEQIERDRQESARQEAARQAAIHQEQQQRRLEIQREYERQQRAILQQREEEQLQRSLSQLFRATSPAPENGSAPETRHTRPNRREAARKNGGCTGKCALL